VIDRWRLHEHRPLWVGLTGMILVAVAAESLYLFRIIADQNAVGLDFHFYQSVARRWVDTGVYYTDAQLAGPFQVRTEVDNLYPPHAIYLFVPFLVLPGLLWWIIPLGIVGYVVWWCLPVAWSWPILAALVLFPKTPGQIIYGNTDIWVTAFIAAGVRWGWPSTLISLKPSLAVFGLLGIRTRAWWVAVVAILILSAPFLALWLEYPTVTRNSSAAWYYSFGNLPFFVLPIVAWFCSSRRDGVPVGRWAGYLLARDRRTVKGSGEGS
jgi:hypothetical protein